MTSDSRAAAWLAAFQELAAISDRAWREALRAAKELQLPHGTTVVRRGDPCQSFLLVLEGTIRVYENSEGGREISLYRTCGGELCILTLSGLFASGHYAAEARTDGAVRVAAIPVALFRRAMGPLDRYKFRTSPLRNLAVQAAFFHNGSFTRLDRALRYHLNTVAAAPGYDPAAEGLDADLTVRRGPIEPVLKRLDPLLVALGKNPLTSMEYNDLLVFVRDGLLDTRILPANLCSQVPATVPSGIRQQVFQGC